MDDANLPSLPSRLWLGLVDRNDPFSQNSRKTVLSRQGNPYSLEAEQVKGSAGRIWTNDEEARLIIDKTYNHTRD